MISIEQSAVIWMGLPLCVIWLASYVLQNYFFDLWPYYFNYNILWSGSTLVMSAWCPRGFCTWVVIHFLRFLDVSWYYYVEYLLCFQLTAVLLFQCPRFIRLMFRGVIDFLHILFIFLHSLTWVFIFFQYIYIYIVFKSWKSSTCSSMLQWLSTILFDIKALYLKFFHFSSWDSLYFNYLAPLSHLVQSKTSCF
jgi:hypothetical protein